MGLLIGPTWVIYGRVHMGMTVWDTYRFYMDVPTIWVTRIHPTLGPYMIGIWATHEPIIGVSICACPHWTQMGVPIWAWPYVTITHGSHIGLLSRPHMGQFWECPYGLDRMGPILACPYGQARIHPTLGQYGLAIRAPHWFFMGVPIWACPYAIWVM